MKNVRNFFEGQPVLWVGENDEVAAAVIHSLGRRGRYNLEMDGRVYFDISETDIREVGASK